MPASPVSLGSSDKRLDSVFSSPEYPSTMVTTPPTSNPDLGSSPLNGRVNNDSGPSHPQKRTHLQFSLPSEETVPQADWDPRKKVKKVYTTVSARKSREVEDLHSLRMLQLARASRRTFAAHAKYCRLRLQEIEVMRIITVDECETADACLRKADSQLGEIRHLLHAGGTALGDCGIPLFGEGHDSDGEESLSSDYKSPTPSDFHHAI